MIPRAQNWWFLKKFFSGHKSIEIKSNIFQQSEPDILTSPEVQLNGDYDGPDFNTNNRSHEETDSDDSSGIMKL